MAVSPPLTPSSSTHEVANQPPPRPEADEYGTNRPLVEAIARHEADWATERLHAVGRVVGTDRFRRWSAEAEANPPRLLTHDAYGNRLDEVEYHPSYHAVMRESVKHGSHAIAWRERRPGAHVARAAVFSMFCQVEPGHTCPISMTHSIIPALRAQPELAAEWEPRITSLEYDPELRPAGDKPGVLSGMAMTEKQGGSDVRANTTVARPIAGGGAGGEYELVGHKWFCSAPMCDVFLTLAQTEEGLSCFLLPRVLEDGSRNAFRLQRLKDKLGNRANASSEVEFAGAWARMVGEPGRGVHTIIQMVNHTRLDCALATTAGMRHSAIEAASYAAKRSAFGKLLIDQPLMKNVLADLCLEVEAATVLSFRLAASYEEGVDEHELAFRRIATPIAKYWICKRGPNQAFEALECLGGNGYIETFSLARRYREQPLTSIWEGSGNVICLDVLRALPKAREALFSEIGLASGVEPRFDAYVAELRRELDDVEAIELRARRLTERMALALQASLLLRYSPSYVAEAFCAARLDGEGGAQYGTLPRNVDFDAILERHAPALD
jgi:putative acyl-CoA dehydrogenase